MFSDLCNHPSPEPPAAGSAPDWAAITMLHGYLRLLRSQGQSKGQEALKTPAAHTSQGDEYDPAKISWAEGDSSGRPPGAAMLAGAAAHVSVLLVAANDLQVKALCVCVCHCVSLLQPSQARPLLGRPS